MTEFPAKTIKRNEKRFHYLREIEDFICLGESLAGYLARHVWGGFLCYLANLFFFEESPSPNFLHCMNRLEIAQAKLLLAIGFFDSKAYTILEELPILQKRNDATAIGGMLARELRSVLPKDIDADHLEMAVTLQGCGHHLLYTCLQPTLWIREKEYSMAGSDEELNQKFFDILLSHLSPDIAAMCAANFRCPWEVSDALQNHLNDPKHVSPLCATLKLINYLVENMNNPTEQEDYLNLLLKLTKISMSDILNVVDKMQKIKKQFIDKSSAMVASASQDSGSRVNKKLKDGGRKPLLTPTDKAQQDTTNLRHEQDFHQPLCTPAMEYIDEVIKEATAPRPKEKWNDFLERIKLFHVRRLYAKRKDFQVLLDDYGISEKEVRAILKIKK